MKEPQGVRIDSRGCFKGFNVEVRRELEDNQQRGFTTGKRKRIKAIRN